MTVEGREMRESLRVVDEVDAGAVEVTEAKR